ncbi:MAG: PhnD/SsuA/transferrin family substrate-binding protein [Planctomycetes bacterium]|nr:PhnD/SsuA/transferrin family substrate-binding protein [Planctomycetota bacterium]
MKLLLLLTAAVLTLNFDPTAGQTPRPDPTLKPLSLRFGVYQTDKATVMYKRFTPFLETLQEDVEKRLSRPCDIELTIFKSYDEGIDALTKGSVDFVHFGPASYVTAKERNAEIRLVAIEHENGEKFSEGVIVVAKASPIQTIEELRGKKFAFGDKNSTIGRYLVQAELVAHGIHAQDLAEYKYLDRHDLVASAVEYGDFDAGSVKYSTYKKANEKNTLRALATFKNVTKPIVARAGLDSVVFTAIQDSLFAYKDEAFFKDVKISGFTVADDADFKLVRDGMKKANRFEQSAQKQ